MLVYQGTRYISATNVYCYSVLDWCSCITYYAFLILQMLADQMLGSSSTLLRHICEVE